GLGASSAQRPRQAHLVSAAEPDAGDALEAFRRGLRVGLLVCQDDTFGARSELAEGLGQLDSGVRILRRHREDDDAGLAPAGERDEAVQDRVGDRAASDDHEMPASGAGVGSRRRRRGGRGRRRARGRPQEKRRREREAPRRAPEFSHERPPDSRSPRRRAARRVHDFESRAPRRAEKIVLDLSVVNRGSITATIIRKFHSIRIEVLSADGFEAWQPRDPNSHLRRSSMWRSFLARVLIWFVALAGLGLYATAQTNTGNVYGSVTDAQGAALPGGNATTTGPPAPRTTT